MPAEDPRTSDAATGLPPLEELEEETTLVVLAWASSEGIAALTLDGEPKDGGVAVYYLHVRGVIEGGPTGVEWAQIHLAVPVEHAMEVAAALAGGGPLLGGSMTCLAPVTGFTMASQPRDEEARWVKYRQAG